MPCTCIRLKKNIISNEENEIGFRMLYPTISCDTLLAFGIFKKCNGNSVSGIRDFE